MSAVHEPDHDTLTEIAVSRCTCGGRIVSGPNKAGTVIHLHTEPTCVDFETTPYATAFKAHLRAIHASLQPEPQPVT